MVYRNTSTELVNIINTLVKDNRILAKLLINNTTSPYSTPDKVDDVNYNYQSLIMTNIYPFPFDNSVSTTEKTELRVFFGKEFYESNANVQDRIVVFDIITAKSLWRINANGVVFRPYEIKDNIIETFRKARIPSVGNIVFVESSPLMVNETFSGIRLIGKIVSFNDR